MTVAIVLLNIVGRLGSATRVFGASDAGSVIRRFNP